MSVWDFIRDKIIIIYILCFHSVIIGQDVKKIYLSPFFFDKRSIYSLTDSSEYDPFTADYWLFGNLLALNYTILSKAE